MAATAPAPGSVDLAAARVSDLHALYGEAVYRYCRKRLRSHEDAEQVYVVVRGVAELSAAGDTESLEPGDLALIPPASDHVIANRGDDVLALLSVQSPAVSVEETIGRQSAATVGYDEDSDQF